MPDAPALLVTLSVALALGALAEGLWAAVRWLGRGRK